MGKARPEHAVYRPGVAVRDVVADGERRWEYTPRAGATSPLTILFFHGGSWMFGLNFSQSLFVAHLVRHTGGTARIVRYPLFPAADGNDYRAALLASYRHCLDDGVEPGNIVVMGDSAGGHASLVLYHLIRRAGLPQPRRYILISPAMDLASIPNAEARRLEARDPLISLTATATFAKKLCAGLPVTDPRVSPNWGDFTGCPPIDIFVGTEEVLSLAPRLLAEKWAGEAPIRVHLGRGGIHDWPLLPTREGHVARSCILQLLDEPVPAAAVGAAAAPHTVWHDVARESDAQAAGE